MRFTNLFPCAMLSLALAACSGVDIQPQEVDRFSAGNYHFYKWRTGPLPGNTRSSDPLYKLDPILRRDVDAVLQGKGYALDPERAEFTVDYLFVTGLRQGEQSELASNISPYPRVTPNRNVDQASVDNAIALGGVKETNNIILQFNDRTSNEAVWHVTMTSIVENANRVDISHLENNMRTLVERALKSLPPATAQ